MGLDMYLEAEVYVNGWSHNNKADDRSMYQHICEYVGMEAHPGSPSGTVTLNVGYWRKANAVHNWFVHNVGEGKDECQRMYLSREDLNSLRAACQQALLEIADGHLINAAQVMPPAEGFFFGNAAVDAWYIDSLEETIKILNRALELPEHVSLYYQASW